MIEALLSPEMIWASIAGSAAGLAWKYGPALRLFAMKLRLEREARQDAERQMEEYRNDRRPD